MKLWHVCHLSFNCFVYPSYLLSAPQCPKLAFIISTMKKIIAFIFCVPLFLNAQDKDQFTIKGKIKDIAYKPDWVFLQYRTNGQWQTDSVQTADGKYSFSGMIGEPGPGYLRVKYAAMANGEKVTASSSRDNATLFLQKGKIKVASVDSFSNMKVKGSAAHSEYEKLVVAGKPYDEKRKLLITEYREYGKLKDKENQAKTENKVVALDKEKGEAVYAAYVKSNPSSPIALWALKEYGGWDIDADKVEPLFNTLSATNKNYPSAAVFQENIAIAKKTGVGKMAMDFTQNDTLGIPVSLSSFKGKYVFVDFWASWCGPCRNENPNVVKTFQKYKDKNFHIVGVSLDRPGQKEKWMKAIHDDELTWTQLSDLKFWDNDVAKLYGIKAIPQNFLVGPDGTILAKNLNGAELDAKLGELGL